MIAPATTPYAKPEFHAGRLRMEYLTNVVAAFITFVTYLSYSPVCLAVAKTIATALISSRLHYCNSLHHNIALKDILKLQCAKLFGKDNYLVSLFLLHWLPNLYRFIFKICTITYQALSSRQPAYLHSLKLFPLPHRLWNSLLVSVKSVGNITFQSKQKNHLFRLAYLP